MSAPATIETLYQRVPAGCTPAQGARQILDELKVPAKAAIVLEPVVALAFAHWRRQQVAVIETVVPTRGDKTVMPAPDARAKLLAATFSLFDGSRVSWGEATVEQHQQRIDRLTRLRGGIDETIRRHRWAIERITEAGASCLAEVDGDLGQMNLPDLGDAA